MYSILTDWFLAYTTDIFMWTAVPNPTTDERAAGTTVSAYWR